MLKARAGIHGLKSYHPPLGNREGLRLDFNENTAGCSPRVLERLRNLDAETLARYPEREPSEAVVAAHLGIEPVEVLLTNGTDEAIHLICETYLEPGDEALICVPTFAMYEIYAAATEARVIPVPAGTIQRGRRRRKPTCCASRKPRRMRPCWWMRPISSSAAKL